ncbi:MAG: ubiquinone/menaquinone biosynthesis methyltransferase [Coriobacteriales bacterium]|jgi:demethylmenaquinone methyltransferase/2-methoxy-6-polyprenyl-1,4-benzoquinol methylase|nr:ubiquinone/menaquinone biosynthesis methyltransferase [Coriobacteriales bacterium]
MNDTNAVFAKIAKRYDAFNAISSFGINRHWTNVFIADVAREAPKDVLDVAGGTGEICLALLRLLPWANITLSDISTEMLDVARQRLGVLATGFDDVRADLALAERQRVSIRYADAQELPFNDASYDAITCAYGIRNVVNRDKALAEFYRVLRPGGSVHILEFTTPPGKCWRALYHLYLQFAIPNIGKLLTGNKNEFEYLRQSILEFPKQHLFCEKLHTAGFSDIRYRNLTGGLVAVYNAYKVE